MAIFNASDDNFNELKKEGVAIVDFFSTHCGPCRALLPTLLKLETELPFISLIKVNTDDCPKLSEEYRIDLLPTLYLCKEGQMKEYDGERDEDSLREAIGALLYE